MNTHSFRAMFGRRHLAPLIAFLLLALVAVCGFVAATARSSATGPARADNSSGQTPGEKKKVFTDEDLKVEKLNGKWSAQCVPDPKQAEDFSVPVYVKGTNLFWGTGKYLGRMKVPEVMLENRSQRLAQSVQLKWAIVGVDEPDVVLLEGTTPLFETRVEPFTASLVDIPEIYFNKILKPLRKNDELNGSFRLLVGVEEVRFSDGTVWQPPKVAASSRTPRRGEARVFQARYVRPSPSYDALPAKGPTRQP